MHARDILSTDHAYLDTETTGLGEDAQIVEIAIIDRDGRTLVDTLVRPTIPVPADAERVHGITGDMLADAPTWPEVEDEVRRAVSDRVVVIYNADYDTRLLRQTAAAHTRPPIELDAWCAMMAYAEHVGDWDDWRDRYRWHRLTEAARREGVHLPEGMREHRALADCRLTRGVVRAMGGLDRGA